EANPDGTTFLSRNLLDDGSIFYCRGLKPWLGDEVGEECGCHLRGSLRSGSNLYFAQVKSAIYLPRVSDETPEDWIALFEQPPLSTLAETLLDATSTLDLVSREKFIVSALRKQYRQLLEKFSDAQISNVLELTFGASDELDDAEAVSTSEDIETR